MRFTETGPSIPNDLLQKQQQGGVIFFCGAGISMPQLPSFWELADQALQKLNISQHDRAYTLLHNEVTIKQVQDILKIKYPDAIDLHQVLINLNKSDETLFNNNVPLDQVFDILQDDYPAYSIDKAVHELLATKQEPEISNHQTILKLSSNRNKQPLVITTNFDHFFEKADNNLEYWESPLLPIHTDLNTASGIIYLHGRLSNDKTVYEKHDHYHHNLILSSSDFGRAYLTEAWATQFIRYVLEHKTIILLGYSADDPPVKYLLHGLKNNKPTQNTLYAFAGFDNEKTNTQKDYIQQRWQGLGVTPILYNQNKKVGGYGNLWQTLKDWSEYASDLDSWQKNTIQMAQSNRPESLKPYQRGQVVELVSTTKGAKYFAEAEPPISSEWLCVFDNNVRYEKPSRDPCIPNPTAIPPYSLYHLDDDPPPDQVKLAINVLKTLPTEPIEIVEGLSAENNNISQPISNHRLKHLTDWFIKISHEPTALLWAVSNDKNIHPRILFQIEYQLNEHRYNHDVKKIWLWLIESNQSLNTINRLYRVEFENLRKRVGFDDWSYRSLRYLETILTPKLKISLNEYKNFFICKSMAETQLPNTIRLELNWLDIHQQYNQIDVPDNQLVKVLNIITRVFQYTLNIYPDIPEYEIKNPIIFIKDTSDEEREETRYFIENQHNKLQSIFEWTITLLIRYCSAEPQSAKQFIHSWPNNEPYFFDTLRLAVWLNSDLNTPQEILDGLLTLTPSFFEDHNTLPVILYILKKYWNQLTQTQLNQVEQHLFTLHQDYDDRLARILGWLEQNDCLLPQKSMQFVERQREIPDWDKDFELSIAKQGFDVISYAGKTTAETMPDFLINQPLKDIILLAEQHQKNRHYIGDHDIRPFQGLIQQSPRKALAALVYQHKNKNYPIEFWVEILENWSNNSSRLTLICGLRLIQLPKKVIHGISQSILHWLKHSKILVDQYPDHLLRIWDTLFNHFINEATNLSERYTFTVPVPPQRFIWFLSYELINITHISKKITFEQTKPYLEKILNLGTQNNHNAYLEITKNIECLHKIDPQWTATKLVPLFNMHNPTAQFVWQTFLGLKKPLSFNVFQLLKKEFLNLPVALETWFNDIKKDKEDMYTALGQYTIALLYFDESNNYLTPQETHNLLQYPNGTIRLGALNQLDSMLNSIDHWEKFGKSFFTTIWPKNNHAQTAETSRVLVHFLFKMRASFPDVLKIIFPYLQPLADPTDIYIFYHDIDEDDKIPIIEEYPLDLLKLFDKIIPQQINIPLYKLDIALEKIATQHPEVKNWPNWQRLRAL